MNRSDTNDNKPRIQHSNRHNERSRKHKFIRHINKAYKILDNFKDEIIREDIKRKQGGTNDREGC